MRPTNPNSGWGPAEAKKAASGRLPEPVDLNHSLYLAWIRDCDARKCHSLALTEPSIDPLLRARALLFRGELENARAAIDSLSANAGATAELKSDALLEAGGPVVFLSANLERTSAVYANRGYRWALIEVGAVMQNAYLVAAELGVPVRAIGGFRDAATHEFLGLPDHVRPMLALLLGS